MDHHYPALKSRRTGLIDERVDQTRRVLWRADQHGSLTAEELASTLERLESESLESFCLLPEDEMAQALNQSG